MKKSEIKFTVTLDENNLPEKIDWSASDAGEESTSKAVMIALWDAKENNTLRIDLWTKDMMVDEMADFYYQTMMGMADTYLRATQQKELVDDMKKFAKDFYKKFKDSQLKENK